MWFWNDCATIFGSFRFFTPDAEFVVVFVDLFREMFSSSVLSGKLGRLSSLTVEIDESGSLAFSASVMTCVVPSGRICLRIWKRGKGICYHKAMKKSENLLAEDVSVETDST